MTKFTIVTTAMSAGDTDDAVAVDRDGDRGRRRVGAAVDRFAGVEERYRGQQRAGAQQRRGSG